MPRTRQRQSLNGSHAEDLNDSVTMSRDNFTALLTTIQQSNADMCERMLQRLSATASTPTASPAPTPSAAERTGNFARCTSRFSGSAKENVETFIDAIEAYKECTNVYDDVAIKGMSMLLTDDAATWWQSIRSEVSSWNDVIKYLRDAYGDRRPEYKIYRELFRIEQAEDVRTDIFIAKSRALLSRLPAGDLSLKVQLDMVYGLLHRKIRKRLRREEFNNFSELLNKSRIIEETIAESTKSEALYSAPKNTAAKQPAMYSNALAEPHGAPAARRNDGGGGPLQAPARPLPARPRSPRDETAPTPREPRAPRPPPERAPASTTRQEQTHTSSPASSRPASRPFCVSCRRFGHRKEQCRKSTGTGEAASQTNNNPVSCYQCGTQNVTRENCKQCNNEQSFYSIAPRCVSYSKSTQQSNHNISNNSYVANCIESTSHSNIFSNNNCVQQNSGSCDSPRINERPSKQKLDSRYLRKQNRTCSINNLKLNKEFADVHLTSNVVKCYHEYVTKNNSKDNMIIDNARCELGCKRQLSTIVPENILCCDDADDDYSSHYFNMCNDSRDIEGCNQYACNLFSDSFCSCNCFKHKLDIKVCSDTIYCDESTRAGDGNHDKLGIVSRPIFNVKILGASGTALVDTGAKNCIAGHTLHILLRRKGHPLQPARRRIKLADGHARELDVLLTTLDVHLEGKVVQAPFLILPDARQNETLLGMDFLLAASLIMDFARKCWCFSENHHVEYPMQFEPSILPQLSCSSADVLRKDEGTVLTQPERDLLEQTLVDNGDIFQLGGEPTPYAEHRIDTGEHPPISVPPYRLTPAKKELMLLQQRNEVLAVDLFGPLPEGENGERWILLVEDTATRWVELFALQEATAEACARVLTEEYFLRYGLPRRVTSDNGVQFVGAVMQQCMFILGVKQNFVPLYHPEANPAERKNRDLKVQLAQLVENDHGSWSAKLPVIRFALNSAVCRTTGATPAFLMFAREMRSPTEARHDLRAILDKENFLPQITPYLRSFISNLAAVRERVEGQQDQSKRFADQARRPSPKYKVGDKVLVRTHALSQGSKGLTAKFFPKRDGPYVITKRVSPTTFIISPTENPADSLGKYHTQDITPFVDTGTGNAVPPNPVRPKRRRGRPKRSGNELVQERGRSPELEGEYVANRITPRISGRRQTRVPARFLE
nr:uncharacterized protein LOC126054010 [Helicoverpa armigera]